MKTPQTLSMIGSSLLLLAHLATAGCGGGAPMVPIQPANRTQPTNQTPPAAQVPQPDPACQHHIIFRKDEED